ncbi:MAG: hypothetical protein RIS44_1836 [Pseudomonadota bacterium]
MRSTLLIPMLIVSTLFAGCAARALSPEEAKAFASLSLSEFLKARFAADRQSKSVQNGYVYEAFFNGVNFSQLERPFRELASFCSAQGSDFRLVKAFDGDPIGRYVANPLVWANSYREDAKAVAEKMRLHPMVVQLTGENAAESGFKDAQLYNSKFKTVEAKMAYEKAALRGAFGLFDCINPTTNSKRWSSVVLPVGFQLKQANNDLLNNALLIQIAPTEVK